MNVKIYSTPLCPFCKKAKAFFKENNIAYEEFDVAEDEHAREEMIKKSGKMSVPVIEIDEEIFVGFDADTLRTKLDI